MKTGFRRRVSFKTSVERRVAWKLNFPSNTTNFVSALRRIEKA
jgi:hypothetical protein